MKTLLLYFLIGAIVSVWTAINQVQVEGEEPEEEGPTGSYAAAYILIALAWPVSVIVSVYSLLSSIFVKDS
ncbi:MAG: hypothetical protein JXX14_13730 [Deltaproteobacteria bacterium]|nr:hypothetical protein [Deltaproteobacteria bacterium]